MNKLCSEANYIGELIISVSESCTFPLSIQVQGKKLGDMYIAKYRINKLNQLSEVLVSVAGKKLESEGGYRVKIKIIY